MNYYEILEVSVNASDEVIKMAYKALAKKYHPDTFSGDKLFAEQQMKSINTAYEILSNAQRRKEYNMQNNIPVHESTVQPRSSNTTTKTFSFHDRTIDVCRELSDITVWRSELINQGIDAAQNFIRCYKSIMNGYGKVQSFVGKDLINIGLDLFCYHIDKSVRSGASVLINCTANNRIDFRNARAYLSEYIKDYFERCVRYYKKSLSGNTTAHLSTVDLSSMAYKVYMSYVEITHGITDFLRKSGILTLPATALDDVSFAINCENEARSGILHKGDLSVLDRLLNLILFTPYRIDAYCILYYLYGDDKKELEKIADFFGMKKQYSRYKDSYCKNQLRVEEKILFYIEANRSYTPINWEIFGAFYPFYRDFEHSCDVTDNATINGFIENAADEIREHLYYTTEELFNKKCTNINDPFSSASVFWASMALLSMHFDEITEEEYITWATNNPYKLKDALLKYYAFAKKHTLSSSSTSAKFSPKKVTVDSPKTISTPIHTPHSVDILTIESDNKRTIDAALQNHISVVWDAAEKGNAYAEYALENYYKNLCEPAIKIYDVAGMESILTDVYQRAKAGSMCAAYIFASLTHKIHAQDRRNTTKAQQAADLILNLAEYGNISAITQKGFWGTHGYYNATKTTSEGVRCLQIGVDHHHPVALAWLGSYYRTGKHVPYDSNISREYLELGAMYGQPYAVKELQKLNNGNTSSSSCFITTAVCASFGKSDDCYELEVFRWFRDNWLIESIDGQELIKEYYVIAPKIVDQINLCSNKDLIYEEIWHNYLHSCLNYIENREYLKCKELYMQMVQSLRKKYLPSLAE